MAEAKYLTHASEEPLARIEQLVKFSKMNSGDVDHHIPPIRYYYYGLEMLKRANGHHNDGHLEKAYVLYINYITLFTEKIHKHPASHTVPPELKARNETRLKDALVREKALREELLNIYQEEYDNYQRRNWEMCHDKDGNSVRHDNPPAENPEGSDHPQAAGVRPMSAHEFIVLRRMGMLQNYNNHQ